MDQLKNEGNNAFSSGDYNTAIQKFTQAIDLSPNNHVLYSNRSASYCALRQYDQALIDAEKTIQIEPSWSKVFYYY